MDRHAMRLSVDPGPDVWVRTSAEWKQRTMNVDEVGLVQMAFRYLVAVSEDDSEVHIAEIYSVKIDVSVTDDPDRKPSIDRRKNLVGEDTSDNDLGITEPVGSPTRCRLPARLGRPAT